MKRLKFDTIRLRWRFTTLSILAILLASGSWADAAGRHEPLAEVIFDSASLRFAPKSEAKEWVLTVSGPGSYYLRGEFRGAPRLDLVGTDGALLPDGQYTWELRAKSAPVSQRGQVGYFQMRNGSAVVPDPRVSEISPQISPVQRAPTTFNDDVFVQGELGVGFDISGTENLAFTTLLLKENNVRIWMQDTSVSPGFATTDWEIKVNQAPVSGLGIFAIRDLDANTQPFAVEAAAGDNSFYVDSMGRVGLGTATPGAKLQVMGDAIVDGDFTAGSSREIKHAFESVDQQAVLERLIQLPISEWSYRSGDPEARHVGPVSEDFSAAFGLGRDDRHLSPLDVSGVALAAIQGLSEIVRERDAEIEELRRSRDELTKRLEVLERLVGEAKPTS